MDVTYTPEGGAPQSWSFVAGRVPMSEAERIEAHAGCTWDEWITRLQSGAARARRVLLWHLMRRQHPSMRYEDTPDFMMSELVLEYDAAELQRMLDNIDAIPVSEDEKNAVRAALMSELEKAHERGGQGKAPTSNDSDSATA